MGGLTMEQAFVQAPEHCPKPTITEATGIPLIDLSPLIANNGGDVDALAAEVWSNDRYESAEHRVSLNSARERFSLPYFFNPASYTMVEPLEELVSEDDPPKYKPYNWGEFMGARRNSNFRKLNVENVQITHFKKSLVS